jgi:type VI secretion system protein ImpJ
MLMSPQHLQQQDLYHEGLLHLRLSSITPFGWGVGAVEFDTGALSSGEVGVLNFWGVLPGGLPISFRKGEEGGPPPRSLEGHFEPTQKVVRVYLGVATERLGVANIGKAGEGGPRYSSASRRVADLVSGRDASVSLAFARPNVRLLFDEEANDDYETLKIGEITLNQAGEFVTVESCVPPCLQIGASTYVRANLRRLLTLMITKRRALVESTSERTNSLLEFRTADISSYLQLSAVNAMLPVMQHAVDTPTLSPHAVYLILADLAGRLMTFSSELDPTKLPTFNVTDLSNTFAQLFDVLTRLLSGTVLKRTIKVEFTLFRNGVMVGELADEALLKCRTFVLSARPKDPSLPPERVALGLPKLSKIASKGEIRTIVQTARNGVPITVTHRPPPEISVRSGTAYFLLDTNDPEWKMVMNERNIALFVPSPFDAQSIDYELIAIPEDE